MPQPEAEDDSEPLPPGAEDEPQAPGTEGDNPAVAYGDGYTDPAYAYAQQAGYGTYTDPQTGYTYPYDPQQYGYDPSYYAYAGYGQYSTAEAAAEAASEAPAAPPGEPGPPTGSPTKAAASGKPKVTSVVQVKLPKQYYEKLQAKKREEEERAKQDLLRKTAEADARRQEAANAAAERAKRAEELANGHDQAEVRHSADFLGSISLILP